MGELNRNICKNCVSLIGESEECYCSLGMDKHLQENEIKCGSHEIGFEAFDYVKYGISDFEFEYGGIDIDGLNEMWINGDDISDITSIHKGYDYRELFRDR